MISRESFPSRPEDVEIAYAQSAAFVEFLRDRHGAEAFGVLIDRVHAGEPFDTAFGVAFHSSRGVEERAFRRELQLRYPWWPLLLAGGSLVWFFTTLLLVAAVIKRRHEVALHRREQERVERLEDLGHVLLDARERPANDSDPIEPPSPWADHLLDRPFRAVLLGAASPGEDGREASVGHLTEAACIEGLTSPLRR